MGRWLGRDDRRDGRFLRGHIERSENLLPGRKSSRTTCESYLARDHVGTDEDFGGLVVRDAEMQPAPLRTLCDGQLAAKCLLEALVQLLGGKVLQLDRQILGHGLAFFRGRLSASLRPRTAGGGNRDEVQDRSELQLVMDHDGSLAKARPRRRVVPTTLTIGKVCQRRSRKVVKSSTEHEVLACGAGAWETELVDSLPARCSRLAKMGGKNVFQLLGKPAAAGGMGVGTHKRHPRALRYRAPRRAPPRQNSAPVALRSHPGRYPVSRVARQSWQRDPSSGRPRTDRPRDNTSGPRTDPS